MPTRRSLAGPAAARDCDREGRSPAWIALAVALAATGAAIIAVLPPQLVLPAASIVMVTTGLVIAAVCYLAGLRIGEGRPFAWDIAGALVFLGFAASLLAGDAHVLSLLAQVDKQGLAALAR